MKFSTFCSDGLSWAPTCSTAPPTGCFSCSRRRWLATTGPPGGRGSHCGLAIARALLHANWHDHSALGVTLERIAMFRFETSCAGGSCLPLSLTRAAA